MGRWRGLYHGVAGGAGTSQGRHRRLPRHRVGLDRLNERFLFFLSSTSSSYCLGYLLHYPLIQPGNRFVAVMTKLRRVYCNVAESPAASPVSKRHNNQNRGRAELRPDGRGRKPQHKASCVLCVSPKSFSFRVSFFSGVILSFIHYRRRAKTKGLPNSSCLPSASPGLPQRPHLAILPSGAVDTTYKHLMCHRHCQLEDRERGKITGKRNIM